MKKILCAGVVAAILLGSIPPSEAWHGHARVFIGPGWWGPPVWVEPYPTYVMPPPVVVAPAPPPVYVEPAPPGGSYFCENPRGYYPQVPQCPGGWRLVAPAPPSGQ